MTIKGKMENNIMGRGLSQKFVEQVYLATFSRRICFSPIEKKEAAKF